MKAAAEYGLHLREEQLQSTREPDANKLIDDVSVLKDDSATLKKEMTQMRANMKEMLELLHSMHGDTLERLDSIG